MLTFAKLPLATGPRSSGTLDAGSTSGSSSERTGLVGTGTQQIASSERSMQLIRWADKCTQVVPVTEGLDVQKECVNLAIGGAGSRTLYKLADIDHWRWAKHDHLRTVGGMITEKGKNAPKCYVVSLREPAARLESYWHLEGWKHFKKKARTVDEWFKHVLLVMPKDVGGARKLPVQWYFRNYSGVSNRLPPAKANGVVWKDKLTLFWSSVAWYKEHAAESQDPGVDVSWIKIDEEHNDPALLDAPLIDCEAQNFVIGFLCDETLVPSYMAFVNATRMGRTITPPTDLHAGANPTLNASRVSDPRKYLLSAENRRLYNEAFAGDDMALYRHFCLGEENQNTLAEAENQRWQADHGDHPYAGVSWRSELAEEATAAESKRHEQGLR
eukprot:Transcript_2149.p1 GENE.Transcript_2149~~Transcript_2149.p1  ORF type:complete len:385 (-),score=40.38 Transcript_2149:160-1314(-)